MTESQKFNRPRHTPHVFSFQFGLLAMISVGWFVFQVLPGSQTVSQDEGKQAGSSSRSHYYLLSGKELGLESKRFNYFYFSAVHPHVILNEDVKAWFCPKLVPRSERDFEIAIESPHPLEQVTGTVYLHHGQSSELKSHEISVKSPNKVNRKEFFSALVNHYDSLIRGGFTGRVWFRHQRQKALSEIGKEQTDPNRRNLIRQNTFEQSFDMFSGARAIAENLQLDRELTLRVEGGADVDVDTIPGITIKEFDWDPHLEKTVPALDELSVWIPEDQHVIFFSSLEDVSNALQEFSNLLMPSVAALSMQSNDRQVVANYFQQLALDPVELRNQGFAPSIGNIAVTGSDPFSELGTDIGVIIQLQDANSARKFARYLQKKTGSKKALDGLEDSGWKQTPDRSVATFFFRHQSLVIITNSQIQLNSIRAVIDGNRKSVRDLKEYRFFRQRYAKSADETAFVFMSDAAIRRWCGARWRIGQSRRLRALAALETLQAENLAKCLRLDEGEELELKLEGANLALLGKVVIRPNGVFSSIYGSTHWMTPISELEIEKVSAVEEAAYGRWRDGYQRHWNNAFDPIGIQLKIRPDNVEVDLSVIPLIISSSYRWLQEGGNFGPMTGDLHHDSLVHLIFSTGMERTLEKYLKGLQFIEVFADQDTGFWRDFTDEKQAQEYFQKNLHKLPVALIFHYDNRINMQSSLDITKKFVESSIVREADFNHRGKAYRALVFPEQLVEQVTNVPVELFLYVYKSDSHVYFSFSRDLIHRVINREINPPEKETIRPWLGKQMGIQLDQRFFQALEGMTHESYGKLVRQQSWKNLPLLNEWRREFPDHDPLLIQQKTWGEKLICAGGGKYQWDEKTHAYLSTAFGNPVHPRIPMGTPFPLRKIKRLDAGLSFETGGVRARIHLEKK